MLHRSLLIIALFLCLNFSSIRAQSGHQIERVSIATDGTQGNHSSGGQSISADGRYIAFASSASNLVSGDTNNSEDVFVHDRQSGVTTRVSVASDGSQGGNSSSSPSISADGRYIAFASSASNLVSNDTPGYAGYQDVFIHDRQSGVTTRVSVASDGTEGNGPSGDPSISADGRYVAFASSASNLVSDHTVSYAGYQDIFVHDRQSGVTTRVSAASDGSQGNSYSQEPSISADGRYVAFASNASNLVSGDHNNDWDVFVHDRQSGVTTQVSVASDGSHGSEYAIAPSISANGRYVAFHSSASNLISNDTNGEDDVFVHDRQTGETVRPSIASDGSQGNSASWYPSISADGRYITFMSTANNLVNSDTNSWPDGFVHDRQTGETTRVSVASDGSQGNGQTSAPSISADGHYATFTSNASNLVSNDTNGQFDVFVVNVSSAPSVPTAAVSLIGLEAVQTIQDWRNSVPMIQDKPTYVRAHVQPSDDNTPAVNVRLALHGERNGAALSGSPLTPLNGAVFRAQPDAASRRGNLNASPYFQLPQSWLNGTVRLTVGRADGGQLNCGEAAAPTPNNCSVTVNFQPAAPLEVHFVPMRWPAGEPSTTDILSVIDRLKAIFPIPYVSWSMGAALDRIVIDGSEFEFQLNNMMLGLQRLLDGCGINCNRLYAGLIKGPSGGSTLGYATNAAQSATSVVLPESSQWRNAVAHEIGHLLGRGHVSVPTCPSENPIPNFPNFWNIGDGTILPTIGPMTQGLHAFIYGLDTSFSPPRVIDPRKHFELMSYCAFPNGINYQWISDFTYERLIDAINQRFAPPSFAVAAGGDLMGTMAGEQDYLIVRGIVDIQANAANFEPFAFVSSPEAFPLPTPGTYMLELLNGSNQVLSAIPFTPDTGSDAGNIGIFLFGVPANPAIKQARIVHSSVVISSVSASNNAPTVTITAPNGGETIASTPFDIQWSANDPDGGDLTALIQYSWNEGVNWESIAVDVTGSSYTIDPAYLRGTGSALFRVQVSDGFNTATDQSDAIFEVAKKSPEIVVHSPADNTFVQTGTWLRLLASAYDVEDGEIPSASFTWSSDIDGALGEGSDLNVHLSPGMHTITVTAADSDNNISSESMTVFGANLLNDDFEWGHQVEFVPYSLTQDTTEATIAADDAMPGCGVFVGGTVWYHFTAPADAVYQFDTFGSDYDTVLVVSSGPREAQIEEGCSDNFGVPQSWLELALAEGKEYHIMIAGNNGATGSLTFNVSSLAPILSAPENYSVTDNRQPTFSWNAAANAVSYEIQLGQNYPPNGTPISVTQTSYTPPSPLFTTTYYWRVRAVHDGSVKTDWSATRVITINAANNAAPLRYFYTTPAVTLTWNAVSWAAGYEVEIYDNAALMGAPVDTYSGSDTQMTSTLPKEGTYYWRVRALRVNGAGAWSKAEAFGVGSP